MKRLFTILALTILVGGQSFGQQDPMFTKYMFNSLTFNPAYAGSWDHMTVGLLHRSQWVEIEGAPTTQSLTLHTPLKNERIGVGLSLINDKIGPTNSTSLNLAYAYKIPIGKMKLSIGLQAGMENYNADWTKLETEEGIQIDEAFAIGSNKFLPNFGAGLYLSNDKFYFGVSSPQLVEYDLRDSEDITTAIWARSARHYYMMTGLAIPIKGKALVFKPSILVKNVGLFKGNAKDEAFRNIGAPNEFDLDLSLLFQEALWVGTSFRSAFSAFGSEAKSSFDSVDFWVSYNLKNGMRIGAAYDYPVSDLRTVTSGAFELMLGYEFDYKNDKVVTPRYF
jgi:type IX secretion system PorP/SprF family membrane protein